MIRKDKADYRRWEPIATFSIMLLVGTGLMGVGCFVPYSGELSLAIYTIALIFYGFAYFCYYGLIAPPSRAFFAWVYIFYLFPKKAVRGEYDVLLSALSKRNQVSFYEIVEVISIVTLIYVLLMRPLRNSAAVTRLNKHVDLFFSVAVLAAGVGVLNLTLCFAGFQPDSYEPFTMVRSLWPLIVGVVVWWSSARFVKTEDDMRKIMFCGFLAGLGLALEFLVAKYTALLPPSVLYFEFDPQLGHFRSAWQSTGTESGLLVGQYLIIAIGCAWGLLLRRRPWMVILCSFLFLFVILYTYNRGSVLAGVLTLLTAVWFTARKWRVVIATAAAFTIMAIVIPWHGKDTIVRSLGVQDAKTEFGFFSTASLFQRFGAQMRGLEVFVAKPLLGAGPGHLGLRMPDPAIPQFFDVQNFDQFARGMYANTTNPESRTNSHNLMVDLMAEYGVVGLLVALIFLIKVARTGLTMFGSRFSKGPSCIKSAAKSYCIASFSILIGMCAYYGTQAAPLIFGLLALMLRLVTVAFHKTVEQTRATDGGMPILAGCSPGAPMVSCSAKVR